MWHRHSWRNLRTIKHRKMWGNTNICGEKHVFQCFSLFFNTKIHACCWYVRKNKWAKVVPKYAPSRPWEKKRTTKLNVTWRVENWLGPQGIPVWKTLGNKSPGNADNRPFAKKKITWEKTSLSFSGSLGLQYIMSFWVSPSWLKKKRSNTNKNAAKKGSLALAALCRNKSDIPMGSTAWFIASPDGTGWKMTKRSVTEQQKKAQLHVKQEPRNPLLFMLFMNLW